MPRRVLVMCGSLQSVSANRAALDVAASYLRQHDVDVEEAESVAAIPLFNPDSVTEPGGAVESLRDQIRGCDVVMIAAPEYAGGLAGAVKNALDWIVGSGELYSKPVVVLSAGTSGGVHARQDLIRTLTWQGAHVVGELGITAPRTKSDSHGRYTDSGTIGEIQRLAQIALEAPTLDAEERLKLVTAITSSSGIDPGHIAPAT
jgi:chromate reductase, NAD(P)H dehydrogenase (quinone)